jgi:hypothetical protein
MAAPKDLEHEAGSERFQVAEFLFGRPSKIADSCKPDEVYNLFFRFRAA